MNQDTNRRHLKSWLKYHFPTPRLVNVKPIIVAPSTKTEKQSGLIGTAYDYLFRFKIEHLNRNKLVIKERWVAESTIEMISRNENYFTKLDAKEISWLNSIPNFPFPGKSTSQICSTIKTILTKFQIAKQRYIKFLQDGKLNDDIIESCIFLALLDLYPRCGILSDEIIRKPIKCIADEIKLIYLITDWNKFKAKEVCFLNPTLGSKKYEVTGDADLIIDNTIIEIKTSKKFELQRNHLNQVIGYYFLSLVHPKIKRLGFSIKSIGIHMARYDHFINIPISAFQDTNQLPTRKREFFRLIKDPSTCLI